LLVSEIDMPLPIGNRAAAPSRARPSYDVEARAGIELAATSTSPTSSPGEARSADGLSTSPGHAAPTTTRRFWTPCRIAGAVTGALLVTAALSTGIAHGAGAFASTSALVTSTPTSSIAPAPSASMPTSTPVPTVAKTPTAFRSVAFERARIGSDGAKENFQKVKGKVDFGHDPVSKATLVVDLGTSCFPFESQAKDPDACDPWDRRFEITLDEPRSKSDAPAFELARSMTPFGGPQHLEIDVTDLANAKPGAHELQAFIETWRGGWDVSAHVDVVPGTPPRDVRAAIPLVNGFFGPRELRELHDTRFTVPNGTTSSRIDYRVTGHGQGEMGEHCIGPSEEFCDRTHVVALDGKTIAEPEPWIDSCAAHCTRTEGTAAGIGTYCAENPWGLIASVDAGRANWCPGTLTKPLDFEQPLGDGNHTFAFRVKDKLPAGGGWRVSATLFAFGA
jgi:hypothetical protein